MAGVRISALPVLPSAQASDLYATVQSGTTYQGTLTQLATFLDSNLTYLPLAGGTLTGPLLLNADPTMALGAVTKQYADNIAAGLNPIEGVLAASTTALTVTYNNGTAGVGATLTNATTQAAFVIDGYTASVGDRILIKDQASTFQNGIYTVTDVGSISTNWVLTRPSDFDSSTNIQKGDLVSVINGTVNMGSSWYQTQTVTTVGTDAILFSVFFSPANYIPVALTSTKILVGNGSNVATAVNVSGDATISNTGALTVTKTSGTAFGPYATAALGQLPGTTTSGNASAGNIGEIISNQVLSSASISVTSATPTDICSITLTAGDWDVRGSGFFQFTNTSGYAFVWVNTVSATQPDGSLQGGGSFAAATLAQFAPVAPIRQISISTTTTVYLSCNVSFSLGTAAAAGYITARRIR